MNLIIAIKKEKEKTFFHFFYFFIFRLDRIHKKCL